MTHEVRPVRLVLLQIAHHAVDLVSRPGEEHGTIIPNKGLTKEDWPSFYPVSRQTSSC